MKKSKLFKPLLALSFLAAFTLTACGKGGDGGKTGTDKFKVNYATSEDYEIKGLKEEYAVDEDVLFTVEVKNAAKEVGSVRFDNKKISAGDDGSYKAKMPNHDAELKVTLVDRTAPEFKLAVEGKKEVGQTLTTSTTIAGKDNATYELTATEGADLVQISGHNVQLIGAGRVTLKATANYDVFKLEATASFGVSESEAALGTNIAWHDGVPTTGGEAIVDTNLGKYIVWAGEGGNASSFTYENGEYVLQYTSGNLWYSLQIFYRLPYALQGEKYNIRWEFNSDVEGEITINGTRVPILAGDNLISVEATQGGKGKATLSCQLGIVDESYLMGNTIKFKPARIYDIDNTHVYHEVKFTAGNELLKDIYVRDGKTVVAPEAPVIDGSIFEGFFEDDARYTEDLAITKAYNFTAKYIEKSAETVKNVKIYDGEELIRTVEVATGALLPTPEGLPLGFGYKLKGLFTDSALTAAFDMKTAINADISLYVKKAIELDATYWHEHGAIPDSWLSSGEDGSLTITFEGLGAVGWHIQANFTKDLIIGQSGERYKITYEYSINVAGGTVQIYDGHQVAGGELQPGEHTVASLEYDGGVISKGAYLTFELGGIESGAAAVFTIHTMSIAKL